MKRVRPNMRHRRSAIGRRNTLTPRAVVAWRGRVVIEAVVDRAGQVTTAVVATSSGHRILDRAALVAVKEWMFSTG